MTSEGAGVCFKAGLVSLEQATSIINTDAKDSKATFLFISPKSSRLAYGIPEQFSHIHHLHIAVASARVDPVFHHRHAERASDGDHIRACFQRLSRAFLVDAFILGLFNKAHPAAAAATEALFAILLHLDC